MRCCCSRSEPAAAAPTMGASAWIRRARALVEWAAPVAALALVPKCPACFAGYILLFTGVGLSVSAAAAVRWTTIGVCAGVIALLVVRLAVRMAGAAWREGECARVVRTGRDVARRDRGGRG